MYCSRQNLKSFRVGGEKQEEILERLVFFVFYFVFSFKIILLFCFQIRIFSSRAGKAGNISIADFSSFGLKDEDVEDKPGLFLENIHRLDFSDNFLSTIPSLIRDCSQLEMLTIINNPLNEIAKIMKVGRERKRKRKRNKGTLY